MIDLLFKSGPISFEISFSSLKHLCEVKRRRNLETLIAQLHRIYVLVFFQLFHDLYFLFGKLKFFLSWKPSYQKDSKKYI